MSKENKEIISPDNLKQKHLEQTLYRPLVPAIISEFASNPESHDILVNLASDLEDATELVRILINHCKRKVHISATRAGNIRRGEIGPKGEIFSEHLYVAGKCVCVAKKVAYTAVLEVLARLLAEIEIDAELVRYPQRAIETIGAMGDVVDDVLIRYVTDDTNDVFAREDVASALGAIGTDTLVEKLGQEIDKAPDENTWLLFHALGATKNKKAIPIVQDFLQKYPNHPHKDVTLNILGRLSRG